MVVARKHHRSAACPPYQQPHSRPAPHGQLDNRNETPPQHSEPPGSTEDTERTSLLGSPPHGGVLRQRRRAAGQAPMARGPASHKTWPELRAAPVSTTTSGSLPAGTHLPTRSPVALK
eukprot:CAMPEP_0204267132 /NCGR_PEP_ID=MMETSP0468-20130131/10762_1 /ASSEMBLY_ACC=CAM_ASM_000383 /TAXON_ID=2969 /ORGANISM="Oxyrrhis marina" /LENGTH=117 /DNA_ID=CAMNT_0051242273 /DNA_START=38 /DNA_END=388 /DNA_ORIENTATION=+